MTRPFPNHEAADAERRKQVRLFRYGTIADVIHLERGQRGLYAKLREKAARDCDVPGSRRRKVEVETRCAAGCEVPARWLRSAGPPSSKRQRGGGGHPARDRRSAVRSEGAADHYSVTLVIDEVKGALPEVPPRSHAPRPSRPSTSRPPLPK